MKLFANLMNNPSNDATLGLPNSGRQEDPVAYDLLSHNIGMYDTEFDVGGSKFLDGKTNPDYFDYTVLLPEGGQEGDPVQLEYSFTHPVRQYISYVGEKPVFPLDYADPEPGCCERLDVPFERAEPKLTSIVDPKTAPTNFPTDRAVPTASKWLASILASAGACVMVLF
jgi:hypothetical protein